MAMEVGKDLESSRAQTGLDGDQAAQKQNLNLENFVHRASSGDGGSSSAAAVLMEVAVPQTPRGMKQIRMTDSPSAREARAFWGSFATDVQERPRKLVLPE